MPKKSSLLIIACSKRKRSDTDLLPAIERYDGPFFRIVRRFLNSQKSFALDIYVLSAKFGLISSGQFIPEYDMRMTKRRARELQLKTIQELERILSVKSYDRLLICVGRDYFRALDGYDRLIKSDLKVETATGGLGKKLVKLHSWLYGYPPQLNHSSPISLQGEARLRGVEVVMTPEQVLNVARQALLQGKGNPSSYQSWYVVVDEQHVSPKWLVSQLTGLPVGSFHSREARRMLQKLGIQVYVD